MADLNSSSAEDSLKRALEELEIKRQEEAINKRINNNFTGYLNAKKHLLEVEKDILDKERLLSKLIADNNGQTTELTEQIKERINLERKILEAQQKQIRNTNFLAMGYKKIETSSMAISSGVIQKMTKYIFESDRAFRQLNLTIGLSGVRSDLLLSNLVDASSYGARLGVTFSDLTKIQGSYTDEVGNSVLLNGQNLEHVIQIAKGTRMGVEQAGRMTGKLNLMGKSVKEIRDLYENTVNQSVKFGVSADKVIQNINNNLDRSQQYVFKNGVDGLKKMAMYSTKFKVDMNGVFNAMDKANSLEGAVEMASKLQVIGGKFAQADPFKLLFESRNDAEAFTKSLQSMTAGMAHFDKKKGIIDIQAGDMNRLRLAAEATNQSIESLIEQAKAGARINMIDNLIGGKFTKEQKEFIEGIAQIGENGRFKIQLANGDMQYIENATRGQINALMRSNDSLQKRAESAQAFDEMLKNTIEEIKIAFLPVLKTFNGLTNTLRDSGLLKPMLALGAGLTAFVGIAGALKKILGVAALIKPSLGNLTGGGFKGFIGRFARSGAGSSPSGGSVATGALNEQMKETSRVAGEAWKNMLGFGAAVVMVGGGIWLATKGISTMAETFKGLNGEQLIGLNTSLALLGGTIVGLGYAMTVLTPAVGPLLAFGGAILLIGAGVGIAAAGIGYMVKGFGELFESLTHLGDSKITSGLNNLMLSLTGLSGTMLLFANPLSWIGLKMFSSSIGDIADKVKGANFESLVVASTSFDGIANAINKINESKLDKLMELSESMSGFNGIVTMINSLSNIFGDGIEVKFKDKEIPITIHLTNEIDSVQLGKKVTKVIPAMIEKSKRGTAF